jgi:hypothetical protein
MNISVLYVDDDKLFAQKLQKDASKYEIRLVLRANFREMEESLPVLEGKISCIILDVKGLIEPNSPVPKIAFITKALKLLDGKYMFIPRFILTGDPHGYDVCKELFPDEKLFDKSVVEDVNKLFQEIHSLPCDKIKIKSIYSDVFKVIEDHGLPDKLETQLISLLLDQEKEDYKSIGVNLLKSRLILESVYKRIYETRKDIFPNNFEDISFMDKHNILRGKPSYSEKKQNPPVFYLGAINNLAYMAYKVSCDHGAHPNMNDNNLTKYTVKSCVNAILECILWFDRIMRK